MTTVSAPTAPPAQLSRPAPRQRWDPLAIDAEAEAAKDHDLPPVRPAAAPPAIEDLAKVANILTKAIVEVLLGTRSPAQVQPWLVEGVWHVIRRRAALSHRSSTTRPASSVQVLRVHPCQVNERTCEISVVLHDGRRVRAAALRLTLHNQHWRAAAIRIG